MLFSDHAPHLKPQARADAKGIMFTLRPGEEYVRLGVVSMSVADWATVPDNPIQRDTAARAPRAHHLEVFEPAHSEVSMAVLPDGTRYKLDGHTRVFKWVNGQTRNPPLYVDVRVYGCRSIHVVKMLYGRFDSKPSGKTSRELAEGALRSAQLEFETPMLRQGKFTAPLKGLYSEVFTYDLQRWTDPLAMDEAVSLFCLELARFDSIKPQPLRFVSGISQAALATILSDGEDALPFWLAYNANEGSKVNGRIDPIQALAEALQAESKRRSRDFQDNMYRKGIAAYQAWRERRDFAAGQGGGLRGVSSETAREYCREAYRRREAIRAARRK